MSQFNNDATLDIAIEPRHHASLKEKAVGSAQILRKITGNTDKRASGHMKKYGHLDHTFPKDTRARICGDTQPQTQALARTPENRRDLIRQAEAGQRDFEDGLGDVDGTLSSNPSKGAFGAERTVSNESSTTLTPATSNESEGDTDSIGR